MDAMVEPARPIGRRDGCHTYPNRLTYQDLTFKIGGQICGQSNGRGLVEIGGNLLNVVDFTHTPCSRTRNTRCQEEVSVAALQ